MSASWYPQLRGPLVALCLALFAVGAVAEENYEEEPAPPLRTRTKSGSSSSRPVRRYMVPEQDRVDAGKFHVGFAVGGNFYVEPEVLTTTKTPTGNYFKEFGFQGGMYFDYDYSALTENVPIALRGMLGYKRILSSTNVFALDGMVRWMFRFSEYATFGLGAGASAAVWFREDQSGSATTPSAQEQILFLPSVLFGLGFEYNPFMVDFKWLINRFGEDSSITGVELYFGFRL